MANTVLTHNLWEPLNNTTSAKVDINTGGGNLTIDRLTGVEQALASGTLPYFENQGIPTQTLNTSNGRTTLTLRGNSAGQPWFRLPWAVCNGAFEWHIHLNPTVSSDITAHSDGGNIKLDLAGMALMRLSADTGGGNMDVILPDNTVDLDVTARTEAGNVTVDIGSRIHGSNTVTANSGAGNVDVRVPGGIAVRVHATTGLGKVSVSSRFSQVDRATYQSPGYDSAADKVEIEVKSGAGNVSVSTR
jgi:hypothetical protein